MLNWVDGWNPALPAPNIARSYWDEVFSLHFFALSVSFHFFDSTLLTTFLSLTTLSFSLILAQIFPPSWLTFFYPFQPSLSSFVFVVFIMLKICFYFYILLHFLTFMLLGFVSITFHCYPEAGNMRLIKRVLFVATFPCFAFVICFYL